MLKKWVFLKFYNMKILYIHVSERREKVEMETTTTPELAEMKFIGKKDKRMRFNNAKDPIYYVFDVIENRPIRTLAKEFVKDSFFEAVNFVSKVVR